MAVNTALQNKSVGHKRLGGRLFCKGKTDLAFLFLLLTILATGLVMLFSASAPYAAVNRSSSYYFIIRQLFFAIIGLAVMFIASKFDYHFYKKVLWLVVGFSLCTLAAVLFTSGMIDGI